MAERFSDMKAIVDENLRMGYVELMILQLLSEKDCYGYEMKREIEERTKGVYLFSLGSLYIPLLRMASRGLISSRRENVVGKRFRTYYTIEEQGKEYLDYGKKNFDAVIGAVRSLLFEGGNENE